MTETKIIMGMPITITINTGNVDPEVFAGVYEYFASVDRKYSLYKSDSEISVFNAGKIAEANLSLEMREILKLCEETKKETNGYFDIRFADRCDPSGLVKGWAIAGAAKMLRALGFDNFFIDAGGDIQTSGVNFDRDPWRVGIRNPFNKNQIVKVLALSGQGIATSGNYERGRHIFNPKTGQRADAVAGISVIAADVYEADRFATAAFAMGETGITFLENYPGLEGYQINKDGRALATSGLHRYLLNT